MDARLRQLERDARALEPTRVEPLVRALARAGRWREGFRWLERLEEASPGTPVHRTRLGLAADLAASPVPVRRRLEDQEPVLCLAFDAAEERLALGTADGRVLIHDRRVDWTAELTTLARRPSCLAFSPDGRTLAVGQGRAGVVLLDTATGFLRRRLPGKGGSVHRLVFGAGRLAVCEGDRTYRVHLVDLDGDRVERLPDSLGWIPRLHVSAPQRAGRFQERLLAILEDAGYSIAGTRELPSPATLARLGWLVAADPLGDAVAVWRPSGLRVYDAEGRRLHELRAQEHRAPFGGVDQVVPQALWLGAGARLLVVGSTRAAVLADGARRRGRGARVLVLGDEARHLDLLGDELVLSAVVSPSGRAVALGTLEGSVEVVELLEAPAPEQPAEPPALAPSLEVGSLSEPPAPPSREAPWRLLAQYGELPFPVSSLTLDERWIWARRAAFREAWRAREFLLFDLAAGSGAAPHHGVLEADGSLALTVGGALEGGPRWPVAAGRPLSGRADRSSLELRWGVELRAAWRAPGGQLVAACPAGRGDLLLVGDPTQEAPSQHLELSGPVRDVGFSPAGTRLAALLGSRHVEVFGR